MPESEQCGWLKDKYGMSWQINPTILGKMMKEGSPEQIARVTQAFLKMKKFDIALIEEAYEGKWCKVNKPYSYKWIYLVFVLGIFIT